MPAKKLQNAVDILPSLPYTNIMHQVFAVDISSVFAPAKTFSTYGDLVTVIVKNAFVLAGVISFVIIVWGGFSVVMGAGGGDSKRLEQGKQALTMAVIGLLIVVGSYSIVQILSAITGFSLLGK